MKNKFTEKEIGEFITEFYNKYESNQNNQFVFDFTKFEYISNQNLLLITSLIKYLYKSQAKFVVKLFKTNLDEISNKQAKIIIQLWDVWKLYKVFDRKEDNFDNYVVGFDNSTIPYLKNKYSITTDYSIYNRLGITPFITLKLINDYKDEKLIENEINPIFNLNNAIRNELNFEKSEHPFVENLIGEIITRELYENFLDHFEKSFIKASDDTAFMSISLKRKLGRGKYFINKDFLIGLIPLIQDKFLELSDYINDEVEKSENEQIKKELNKSKIIQISYETIDNLLFSSSNEENNEIIKLFRNEDYKNKQAILKSNILSEELDESLDFFSNKDGSIKNEAYIQYTFIDYGLGIPTTIQSEFKKENKINEITLFEQPSHNELLKYAFKHYTSRHPIIDRFGKTDKYIPRGLFDVLTISLRYKGLLIIRSNYGKILYNFKSSKDVQNAYKEFGNSTHFFPGTYITLYIPEIESKEKFDQSVIRFDLNKPSKKTKPQNINLFTLLDSEFISKDKLYTDLITKLKSKLYNDSGLSRLNYISFFGIKDRRIIKKTLFFLLSDYEINKYNSVIIVNPPEYKKDDETNIINEVYNEILALSYVDKKYKIHPLPLVYYNSTKKDVNLVWLGVYNDYDKKKLDDLLFEEYSLSAIDFYDSQNIDGNINNKDNYGNISSNLPNRSILSKYYELFISQFTKEVVEKFNLLESNGLYLCNGNYYQDQFLQMSDILENKKYRDIFATILYEQIINKLIYKTKIDEETIKRYLYNSKIFPLPNSTKQLKYIAVTSSSHKIVKSFQDLKFIYKKNSEDKPENDPCIIFDNYLDFENELKIQLIENNTDYIIICDAISTGNFVKRIDKLINKKTNSQLIYIAVIVNNIDIHFEESKKFLDKYSDELISLYDFPLNKKRADTLNIKDFRNELIRINPFTNLPIVLNENETYKENIIYSDKNDEFLKLIDDNDINIRFELHNKLIHPFYFNVSKIFEKENKKIADENYNESLIYNLLKDNKIRNLSVNEYVIFYPKGSGINILDKDIYNSKISKNHYIHFFEIERFITDSGWKFPHNSEYFRKVVSLFKNVLIIDDGSCTGDSLLQLVNEISYYDPYKIDLLSIISRIDDYKREFLSKLKFLRRKNERNENDKIEINIYFGSQWHLPVFYPYNNPYNDEIKWLESLITLKNTPQFIKKYANKILETITPIEERQVDYKYFPRRREDGKIPKKEILLTRNEIGKLAGYRFYKESFIWYNNITFSEDKINFHDSESNKQIELLSMCLIYEPYLYKSISKSFPDIKHYLEEFIENIFYNINHKKKIDLKKDLYYDWNNNKKDLIHLFFIVFKDLNLLNFIEDHRDILNKFLEFSDNNINTLDYVLYKLSYYFPLNDDRIKQPLIDIKAKIQDTLSKYPSENNSNKNFIERIIRFNSFTSTLISSSIDNSYENLKARIENYFVQIDNPDYHNKGLNNDRSLINAHFVEIGRRQNFNEKYDDTLVLLKDKSSENLIPYINEILSFSETYKAFFVIQDDYDSLNTRDESLRGLLSLYNEIIYDGLGLNHLKGSELIKLIYSKFFSKEFILYKTLQDQITKDIIIIISDYIKTYNSQHNIKIESNLNKFSESIDINFPFRYSKLLFNELINNLRHSIQTNLIIDIIENDFIININCVKSKDTFRGTNTGTSLFNNLKNNHIFNCDCKIEEDKYKYNQKLTFKII
jgi:hypothetical protein